jgi:hypothetical protein
MKSKVLILAFLLVAFSVVVRAQNVYKCRVVDGYTGEPLAGAVIRMTTDKKVSVITDINGNFSVKANNEVINKGIDITYIGYTKIHADLVNGMTYRLSPSSTTINDVVVTATESRGLTSSSKIEKHAMDHLQPSSFADILELLPGGMAKDPVLNTPNTISIREVPIASGNYDTPSLGTSFVIDGAPISTNANMQFMDGAWETKTTGRDYTNAGVDMRAISTDDIQSVEIVRGIPSVEYGDLTSGLVKIKRRKGGNDISARFKADMDSKLFYLAKGFTLEPRHMSLNISADYLDSKTDPRNILETYKRITLSARLNKQWISEKSNVEAGLNLDYGGSFDDDKVDPELNYGGVDKYASKYNRYSLNTSLDYKNRKIKSIIKSASALVSVSYEKDLLDRTRLVQLSRETPAATTTGNGESDAILIYPYTYTANQKVDGRPFSMYAKVGTTLRFPIRNVSNELKLGADWQMDKNYGDGQIFNQINPLYPGLSVRPRKYSVVPASHILSEYAEENTVINIGKNKLEIQAGIRASTMLNLSRRYALHNKYYLDPRVNIGWTFPSISVMGRKMTIQLAGGYGQHTKMPTMDQLYPEPVYMDLIELNYYHAVKEYRRIYLQTYVVDPTNADLRAARNNKWEIRGDVNFAGNRLSVTYFREDMKSGFRYTPIYNSYSFKSYDASSIDANTITGAPDVSTLPYTALNELRSYTMTTNGSRTYKQGIEYTLSTKRFPVINTRLTINGAWFKTEYRNSQPIMEMPSKVIGGETLQYAGIYKDDDGYIREMVNTNFTFDTDIPKLKLGFSLSAQCLWMTASQNMGKENIPTQYMDRYGVIRDYTEEDKTDTYLQYLVRTYNSSLYDRQTVPFCMNVNLKATKKLMGDKLTIALFVNKLLDYNPDYVRNNYTIRRQVTPYFGLEMNVKI